MKTNMPIPKWPNIDKSDIIWHCRFHPFDWWHEVGCPHMQWTKEQLQDAIMTHKKNEAYRIQQLIHQDVGEGQDNQPPS